MNNYRANIMHKGTTSKKFAVGWLFVVAVLFIAPPVYPQDIEVYKEYKIKVAYIYNFARYIKWPRGTFFDADSPFVIGIFGNAPFGETLDRLAETREFNNRRIIINQFHSPQEYTPCQLLFITAGVDEEQRNEIVELTGDAPVLIVGESPGFANHGAGINFYYDVDTIGFEINLDNLRRRRLQADARLLKLARIVGGDD